MRYHQAHQAAPFCPVKLSSVTLIPPLHQVVQAWKPLWNVCKNFCGIPRHHIPTMLQILTMYCIWKLGIQKAAGPRIIKYLTQLFFCLVRSICSKQQKTSLAFLHVSCRLSWIFFFFWPRGFRFVWFKPSMGVHSLCAEDNNKTPESGIGPRVSRHLRSKKPQ